MTFFKFKNILPKNNKISSNRKKTTGFLANYWIWMGMIDSYKILKQKDRSSGKSKSDRKKLVNLQKQIIWHFLKNFFLFPLWFLSLLVPSYMRGRNNIWTNLRTIGRLINSREFYPLRIAVLSQFVFVFLIVQLGIIVFYKHALPVFGATYTFTQNIWTTASTTATGLHPDNKIGWNYYETASSTITAGNDIRLNTVTDSFTKTSDTDFGGATTSSVEVSGTGDSASIVLTSTVNEIYDWLQPQGGSPTSTVVTDPPVNLYSFRPFAYGGYIYYFNNQGSVYRYNTTQNSWDTLTSVSLGGGNSLMMPPTYDATNGILYFAVANEPGASSAFYSYNLGTSTWTSLHAALNSIHAGWRIYTIPEVVLGYVYIGYENSGLLSRYNIANDTWNNVTGTPLSSSAMNGSNGSNLLYFISTTHLYSYNVGTGESILLNSSVPSVAGIRSVILDKNKENIFLYSYYNFYKYNIANNTWTTLTKFSDSNNFNPPYFYSSQEDNNQIYGTQGFDYTNFYTFNVTDGQWTALADIPNTLVFYLVQDPDNHAIYGASSALPVYKYVSATLTYDTSGTYTSAVIDNGSHAGYTTAEYTTTLNSQTITVDVRSGNTATPDGTWTDWLTGVANGGDISSLDNARYIQYRVNMSTNDITKTPTFNDITVNFNKYTSGELISSKYNTSDSANILANIMWDATTTIDNNIKFQLQTSNNGTDWSGWLGPDGSSNTYFSNTGDITTESLIDSSNDQWFQYKVLLTSNGISTPILSSVTLTYVVNANPVVSNVIATESTDGSVIISYDVLDRDTSNGETPGTILPTFEYLDGNGDWITATTFSENATSSKAVEEFTTSTHSLIWYPKTDFDGQYLNNCQIRVKVNDSEAANNLGTAMSEPFVLDTTSPVISGFLFDGRNDNPNNITITASDDTLDNLLIKISNLNNLNPDGTNASSGIWLAYTPNFTW
ncbi:TPA: hypothetical protein DCQ85_00005, partial [Candidatus Magasanikbacteria bacterium]|nr:hypothetical protein [Candidatus Magasanikbacteria bacterium]